MDYAEGHPQIHRPRDPTGIGREAAARLRRAAGRIDCVGLHYLETIRVICAICGYPMPAKSQAAVGASA
jgi:hypothetical protein